VAFAPPIDTNFLIPMQIAMLIKSTPFLAGIFYKLYRFVLILFFRATAFPKDPIERISPDPPKPYGSEAKKA